MDSASRIETYKQYLRITYADDVAGLRTLMATVAAVATNAVVVIGQSFEGGQTNGQLVLEPMAKLNAILAVLAELDPDNVPEPPARVRFANFGCMATET
jgi:hypothetical protein